MLVAAAAADRQVASIGAYPGYAGDLAVSGVVVVSETDGGIEMTGTLTGLEASVTGGYHIHSGTTCASADDVGGHYFEGMADDPWTTNYESDSVGVSQTTLVLDDFTLDGAYPVAGRAVVIHAADGTRIGCGVLEDAVYASIGPYPGYAMMQSATLGPYPGYDGDLAVAGSVMVMQTDAGIELTGTLSGLEASATGGFHIHSGTTCASADDVGGHYYEGMDADPWTTNYDSDASGDASVSLALDSFTISGAYPVAGRAVVVHAEDGTRIACGLLADISGHVMVAQAGGDIAVSVAIADGPLGPAAGGAHIHSGTTCASADDVGGHYFEGMADDPWTTTYDAYDSTTAGAATFDVAGGFTLDGDYPIDGRRVCRRAGGPAPPGAGASDARRDLGSVDLRNARPPARRASDLVAALVAEAVPAGDGALDLRLPDADLRARLGLLEDVLEVRLRGLLALVDLREEGLELRVGQRAGRVGVVLLEELADLGVLLVDGLDDRERHRDVAQRDLGFAVAAADLHDLVDVLVGDDDRRVARRGLEDVARQRLDLLPVQGARLRRVEVLHQRILVGLLPLLLARPPPLQRGVTESHARAVGLLGRLGGFGGGCTAAHRVEALSRARHRADVSRMLIHKLLHRGRADA